MKEDSRPGYKQTEIGEIPEKWKIVSIGDITDIKGGKRLPKGHRFSKKPTLFPYIRVADFANGSIKLGNIKYLTAKDAEKLKRYKITSKDIYISIAGTIGLVGTIPHQLDGANLTENASRIIIRNKNELNKNFLAAYLSSEIGQHEIDKKTTKTSQPKLALKRIKQILMPIPSISEQSKTANILITVDDAIQKTDGIIAKTEELKKGLVQKLLTEGICHNDFKETEIGRFPVSWNVMKLRNADVEVIDGDRGINYPKKSDFSSKGFCSFLNAKNVTGDGFNFNETQFISEIKDSKMGKGKLNKYDIVLTTRGTIGNVGYCDDNVLYEHIRINSGMVIIRNKNNLIDNKFIYLLFRAPIIKTQIKKTSYGTAQSQLNVKIINNLKIVLPSLEEQRKIIEIIFAMDSKIEIETGKKEKLKELKKGLMQVLLTGKVRVKIDKDA